MRFWSRTWRRSRVSESPEAVSANVCKVLVVRVRKEPPCDATLKETGDPTDVEARLGHDLRAGGILSVRIDEGRGESRGAPDLVGEGPRWCNPVGPRVLQRAPHEP